MSGDQELFESWFRVADGDRDGVVGGVEAVAFFGRSGLPQATLFQIWSMVAGEAGALTKPQFYSTLRLISLAQASGGELPEAAARSALIGIGPALPAPALAGLSDDAAAVPGAMRDSWSPAGRAPAPARAAPAAPGGGTAAAAAATASSAGGWPPMPPADAAAYRAEFARLDADGDGRVSGREAGPALAALGLPRETLRDIWGAVAGDAGELGPAQWVSARYLTALAARGVRPPASLPPGPFPPVADAGVLPGGGVPAAMAGVGGGIGSSAPSADPALPPAPSRLVPPAPPAVRESGAPPLPACAAAGGLGVEREARLVAERAGAAADDAAAAAAEAAAAAGAARETAFRRALEELTLFRARARATALQAQQRAESEARAAVEAEAAYEASWAATAGEAAAAREALDALASARARRVEASAKLDGLKADLARMASLSPADGAAEAAELARLNVEIAGAAGRASRSKARLEAGAAARADRRAALDAALAAVAEAEAALAGAGGQEGGEQEAGGVAERVRALVAAAAAAGVVVGGSGEGAAPAPAPAPAALAWSPHAAAGAGDWDDWADEGFTTVDALPPLDSIVAAFAGGDGECDAPGAAPAPASSDATAATRGPSPAAAGSPTGPRPMSGSSEGEEEVGGGGGGGGGATEEPPAGWAAF